MKIVKKKTSPEIPTSSMADIAFLLIVVITGNNDRAYHVVELEFIQRLGQFRE